MNNNIFEKIGNFIQNIDFGKIPENRKTSLLLLSAYIQSKKSQQKPIALNFICTHNSRRSILSQVWAQTLAAYYQVEAVFCQSGGTEATALFPFISETLIKQGFVINKLSEGNNPIYSIKYADFQHAIIGFSKTYNNPFNLQSQFAAIMTCSSADADCPIVIGAECRIPLTFEDPKKYDNSPLQSEKYKERSEQIATELAFVFQQIK